MDNGRIVGIVLLALGVGLLFFGFKAGDSLSSGFSKLFQGAPSDKSIWLVIIGTFAAALGLLRLLRRRTS